ncbi:MAG: outer membrane protein transport protein [Cryobacterium sp.]|nr:outer membrane protein transport protein [Oligoflexia bacterium]
MLFLLVLFLFPTSAFATNGIHLLASSALGQGRAGATTAVSAAGSDSLLANPSLLSTSGEKEREFEFSLTSLILDVRSKNDEAVPFGGAGLQRRSAKKFVPIPTLSYQQKVAERFTVAFGVVAEAGLSSDQKGNTELLELKPEYSVVKVPVGISYPTEFATFGIAPMIGVAQYATNSSQTIGSPSQTDRGLKSAFGYGISLGASKVVSDHSFGVGIKSKSSFKLKEFADLDSFGPNAAPGLDTLTLESPAQWNIGYGYRGLPDWIFLFDAKRIGWGSAKGFREYGWDNQWVGAIAVERQLGRHQIRAGFNLSTPVYHSESARNATGTKDIQGHSVYESSLDFFNVVGYPAILTKTASVGGTLDLNGGKLDVALLHSFSETIARSGTGAFGLPYSYETKIAFTNVVVSYRSEF